MSSNLISRHKALSYLKEHSTMEVASVDIHGKPHVATVHYLVHSDLTCYFLTRTSTQKATNLRVNHAVAGVVTDAISAATLQLRGEAEDITLTKPAPGIIRDLSEALHKKAYWPSPVAKMNGGEYCLFVIRPRHIRLADFSKPGKGDDSQFYEIAL